MPDLTPTPAIIVVRQPRQVGQDWRSARSWFGGAPRLGGQPWPGLSGGYPMHFFAQLDLAEIAEAVGSTVLPSAGSLAFFVGESDAVVFVPDGSDRSFSAVPSGLTSLEDVGGDSGYEGDTNGEPLFPFWPVAFVAAESAAGERTYADHDVLRAEVESRFPRREFNLTAAEVLGSDRPRWWHTALWFSEVLQGVATPPPSVPRKPSGLSRLLGRRQIDQIVPRSEFDLFADEIAAWVDGQDRWSHMSSAGSQILADAFGRVRNEFHNMVSWQLPYSLERMEDATLIALVSADDDAYASIPSAARTVINADYLLPAGEWHQVLGVPLSIQDNAVLDNEGNHLLLQLVYDDLMRWSFGDCGAYQYWISPEDLSAANWSGATMTFECH